MKLFTIGFTKKSAETFFTRLNRAGATQLVDVRLNNISQLAGFAKKDDLRYFTKTICKIEYLHLTSLAPTKEMLEAYKKMKGEWALYEKQFLDLIEFRQIESTVQTDVADGSCLLCSEEKPHHCHRRLVAEYLAKHWSNVDIEHLA